MLFARRAGTVYWLRPNPKVQSRPMQQSVLSLSRRIWVPCLAAVEYSFPEPMKLSAQHSANNVPSIECVCSGTDREMGFTQGKALKEKITGLWRSMARLDAFRLEQPGWLPYGLYRRLAAMKASKALVPALQKDAPAMLSRLEGISVGSGMPLRNLCLMNAMEALLSSLQGRTIAPPAGCSALGIRATRSSMREPVIAKNFDYIPLLVPFYTIRDSRPDRGFRSLQFTVAAMPGAVDGLNEKGLCITLNYAFVIDPPRPAPLITMIIAEALAHCKTVSGAVEWISQRPRWGAGILLLADAAGGLACLELSNTRACARHAPPLEDWLTCTNVCLCPELREVQVPETELFSERVPAPLRGKPVLAWHARRACRIEELVRAKLKISPDDLAAIMSDHGGAGIPDGTTPCVHTDYWRTTAALQWYPARRRVRVSYTNACAANYVELGL